MGNLEISSAPAGFVVPAGRVSMSAAEFAKATGLGLSTVFRAMDKGEIRSARIMGRRVIPIGEVARLLDAAAQA